MTAREDDRWPFFYRRMQRRAGRRAAADLDYRAGLKPPHYTAPALMIDAPRLGEKNIKPYRAECEL